VNRVLGIDPGVTGAWCLRTDDATLIGDLEVVAVGAAKQIVPSGLRSMLELTKPDIVVLEDNHVMPSNGSKANFSMGLSMGVIIGVVGALSYPLVRLRPQVWKAHIGLSGVKGTDAQKKAASRNRALELSPNNPDLNLVKHHNRADAFLIAEAYRRLA